MKDKTEKKEFRLAQNKIEVVAVKKERNFALLYIQLKRGFDPKPPSVCIAVEYTSYKNSIDIAGKSEPDYYTVYFNRFNYQQVHFYFLNPSKRVLVLNLHALPNFCHFLSVGRTLHAENH